LPGASGARAIRLQYQHTLKGREELLIVFVGFFKLQGDLLVALVHNSKPLQAARKGLPPQNPLGSTEGPQRY
jgi:hypothetical protein